MIVLQAATNRAREGVREDIVLGLLIDTESRSSCCRPERVGRNRGAGVGHVHGGFGVLVQERYPHLFSFFLTSRFLLLLLFFLFSSPYLLLILLLPFFFFFFFIFGSYVFFFLLSYPLFLPFLFAFSSPSSAYPQKSFPLPMF